MNRFTFKLEQAYGGQPTQTTIIITDSETIPDVLEKFAMFMRGCGFALKPTEELVIEDTEEHHA